MELEWQPKLLRVLEAGGNVSTVPLFTPKLSTELVVSFYLARMLLGLLVVVDAYKEDVACIFSQFGRIVLLLYLVDGCFYGMVELQLNDQCRLGNVATGNHHQVGIAFACGILAVDDVLISRPYICHRENARQ